MLVATLHGQTQPVFVDLREEGGGRWELEPPPDEEDEEDEDEDEGSMIVPCARLSLSRSLKCLRSSS